MPGISTEAQTGKLLRECQKDVARAPQRLGWYSFNTIVLNFPSTPLPMLTPFGSSSTTLHCRICNPRVGRFSARIIVGLAETAPRSPCANSHNLKPGNCSNNWRIGVFQIDADVGLGGLAGCSSAPHPHISYRTLIIMRLKNMS